MNREKAKNAYKDSLERHKEAVIELQQAERNRTVAERSYVESVQQLERMRRDVHEAFVKFSSQNETPA